MKTIIITAIAVLISPLLFAQNTLKGNITDITTNEKIPGVTIYIPDINKTTISNQDGDYEISGFKNGEFKIQVSRIGYQQTIKSAYFADKDLTIDISLLKTYTNLNEVVISGAYITSQDESPQAIDVVSKSEMLKTGASTIMDIITIVPGVSAITTGPLVSRPVIRGLSGNRILTAVDGVRFETQQWDDEHGIGVNELGIDRIEIIKGPSTLLYGPEAMGGVIHLIDEQPAAVGHISGDFRSSIFTNNRGFNGEVNAKGATDKYNYSVNILTKSLPDYYFDGASFRAPNTRLIELGGKANFGINRKWGSSSLSYQFNQAQYGILDGKDIVNHPDGSITNNDTLEQEKYPREVEAPYHAVIDNKIISKTTLLTGKSQVQITLGYQSNHRTEYEDNGPKQSYTYVDMKLNSFTYDAKWHLATWKNFSSILGVQGMQQTNKNSSDAKTQLVPDATINDIGFVGLTKYQIGKINLTAGLRYDLRDLTTVEAIRDSTFNMPAISRNYNNLSGAIGATYNLDSHLLLRGNFASGYRSPNLNELISNGVKLESQHFEIGNTNFVKEHNNEIDLGVAYKSKHFSLDVSSYLNNITDYIYLTPTGDSVISNITAGKTVAEYQFLQNNATIKGGEVTLDIHPESIQYVHLELKAATLKGTRNNDNSYLPMMPADKIYCTLIFNLKDGKNCKNSFIKIGTVSTLKQDNVASNETASAGYTLLNIAGGFTKNFWKLKNVEIALAVNNTLDEVYIDHMSRLKPYRVSNPGRNFVFSFKIPFDVK